MADENALRELYYSTLRDLFAGIDSAFSKYSRVRHCYHEMIDLMIDRKVPLGLLSSGEKKYFSERFIEKKAFNEASKDEIAEAIKKLRFAVGTPTATRGSKATGCYSKCCKLMKELNKISEQLGIQKVKDIDNFIDFFTYCPEIVKGDDGLPISENGLEVIEFRDAEHREKFRREMGKMFNKNRIESVYEIISRFYLNKPTQKAKQDEKGDTAMTFPCNYYAAIGIDPTYDLHEGTRLYLESGKEGDIKRLFLDYYKENLSFEQLAAKYPELMKSIMDGTTTIDELAKRSYAEDLDQMKLNIFGNNLTAYMQVLAERNTTIEFQEQRIKDLETELEHTKELYSQALLSWHKGDQLFIKKLKEAHEGKRE